MSTIKSSAENLTLNADGANNDIIFQSNGSNVATLDQAGLLTATTFAGSGASLTALPAAQLTGTLPAISGANLTGITTGKVLQVVYVSSGNETISSSATYADITNLSVAITPSATSSKVLVLVTLNGLLKNASNTSMKSNLVRGSTQLRQMSSTTMATDSTQYIGVGSQSLEYLDSPNTTSATTYKCQIASVGGSTAVRVNTSDNGGATSSITLIEIGA